MGETYLRVGVEIKTKSGPEYEKLTAPEPDHLEQTMIYMAALDLPLMWLLYYNKSNCNYTSTAPPYLFKFDRSMWEGKLLPRFLMFNQKADTSDLPSPVEGFYCQWCPYTWTCNPASLNVQRRGAATTVHSPRALRLPGR